MGRRPSRCTLAASSKGVEAPGGENKTAMQTTTARTLSPVYERVLISRSSAGLPRTYRLVRRHGRPAALLMAVLKALR